MDVDVDEVGRDLEAEESDRLPTGKEHTPIALLDRMEDRPVTERPPRYEQVLEPGAGHVVLGTTDQPVDRDPVVGGLDLDEALRQRRPEQVADPRPPPVGCRKIVDAPSVVIERHRHGRMGQGGAHESLRGMRPLRRWRTEKSAPGGDLREQLMDLDRRADRTSLRHHLPHHAAIDLEAGAVLPRRRAGTDHDPRHLGDRGEGLTAEAERPDPLEILGDPELARRMRRHRQGEILGVDPRPIVDHAHEPHAPLLERDGNPRRPGIERVLKELLDDARRAFDHLAGGDPIHDRHRQGVDAAHGNAIGPPWRRRHGQGQESWNSLILR